MQTKGTSRRANGSGGLIERNGVYYGKWRVGDKQIKRRLGPIRKPGTSEGLTKTQAGAKLQKLMAESASTPPVAERITVEEAGRRYIAYKAARGLKRATAEAYESYLRVHLAPFFGTKALAKITAADVEAFITTKAEDAKSAKSIHNWLGLLHGIFERGRSQGWCSDNPCKRVEKPRKPVNTTLRYLTMAEVEAVIAAVPSDVLGSVERVLYRAAAMLGARQGELLALRWRDVDWAAKGVRIERSWGRGAFDTPKGNKGRSTPLPDALASELRRLHAETPWNGDDDLVFAHPNTGKPIDRSRLLKRYKAAVKRAGVRPVRFHDLRHTWGTLAASHGIPLVALQEWAGWEDEKTARIYAAYAPKAEHAAMLEAAFATDSAAA